MFIAHIRKSDGVEQSLKDHLLEVKQICENNGQKLNMPSLFGLAGLMHDLGKYSDEFQIYLREAVGNPDSPPKRGSVNHSTAGGLLLMQKFHKSKGFMPIMIEMIANVIFSHHAQLQDFVNPKGKSPFLDRANNDKIPISEIEQRFYSEIMQEAEFEAYVMQASKEFLVFLKSHFEKPQPEEILYKLAPKLTLIIFSSLIDADRTNARNFDENYLPQKSSNIKEKFTTYLQTLETSLQKMQKTARPNLITTLRQQMSDNCYEKAIYPRGIYSLSIPTGGGKTLASLRFALKHAIEHGMDRIIYVIPFTTIIEQNAASVKKLLNTEEVGEFHSNIIEEVRIPETYEEMQLQRQLLRAKDNWDIPIVFTTSVQYLNSFYNGKGRDLRRLHNLSNAVIIFDEVQSVPVNCISLLNESINFLTKYAKSTVLLCTATQPALSYVKQNIEVNAELVENLPEIELAFKRTNIVQMTKQDKWTTDQLADFIEDKLKEVKSLLVITNNKKTTKDLYLKFAHLEDVYHLSTAMCPMHRKQVLREMNEALVAGKQVICISTQLIEAGVDVSFECVMRSLAGVDSIAQAAGRCNRNGEAKVKNVYVFKHAEESLKKLPTIEVGQTCAKHLLRDIEEKQIFNGEILSSEAIEFYFKQYYEKLALQLDYPVKDLPQTLHHMLFTNNQQFVQAKLPILLRASFQTVAERFRVIEANTESILVPHGNGVELIAHLMSGENIEYNGFLKKAQQYSVNVFPHEFRELQQANLIRAVDFGVFKIWVALAGTYDNQFGISIKGEADLNLLAF